MNSCIGAYGRGESEPRTALGQLYRMAAALETAQGELTRLHAALIGGDIDEAREALACVEGAIGTERWTLLGMAIAADLAGGPALEEVA